MHYGLPWPFREPNHPGLCTNLNTTFVSPLTPVIWFNHFTVTELETRYIEIEIYSSKEIATLTLNGPKVSKGSSLFNVHVAVIRTKLAVFIKSEMLREVRGNCFCKYQRYPIITIESQNKTIMTDNRHNDVVINYNITNILVTQLERSLQCPPKLLL